MIMYIKNFYKKIEKKPKFLVFYSAIPSAFFFFYWLVCVTAILTSCELLYDITDTTYPQVDVSDVTKYRLGVLEKETFTDKDVTDLVNDAAFVKRWNYQSVQSGQIVLFIIAVMGLAILTMTTISGQNILRL